MRADSRNGKKIPPGKLNIDTDAQTGAKLEHFVLVLIQKKWWRWRCWWWWGWGWWWWWWWWRFDDAGEVTFAGKLKPPPEGQAKLLGAYPITIPLFFAVFCDFFNNKIVFHHYLMNINTNLCIAIPLSLTLFCDFSPHFFHLPPLSY